MGPGRTAADVAVAVAGERLHAVPAAVPVPGDRPAAGEAERGGDPGHAGARGAGAALRRPGRRAHRAAGQVDGPGAVGPAAARRGRSWPSCSPRTTGGRAAGALAGARPSGWWSAGSRWRIRRGWSRRSGSCSWRRSWSRGCGCAGSSTGWTWRRTGEVRIVDYKTGKAPRPEYAEGALFQMKFYALVVWRLKRVVPRRLQLVYLGSGDVLTYDPVGGGSGAGGAQAAGAVGGDPAGDGDGRLAAAAAPSCAAGATTRRSAPNSAGLPRYPLSTPGRSALARRRDPARRRAQHLARPVPPW